MFAYTENSTTFVTVNDKQTFTKPPGLAKSRKNVLSRYKNSGYYRNTRQGKRKINFLSFVAKAKIRFFFPFLKISRKKKRSLKKYRINVIRVPAGDPVHYHSLILSRLS